MKNWKKPEIEELNITQTAEYWKAENEESSVEYQEDLGTCHNPYWAGNGKTQEEAHANNPYWHGGWGN